MKGHWCKLKHNKNLLENNTSCLAPLLMVSPIKSNLSRFLLVVFSSDDQLSRGQTEQGLNRYLHRYFHIYNMKITCEERWRGKMIIFPIVSPLVQGEINHQSCFTGRAPLEITIIHHHEYILKAQHAGKQAIDRSTCVQQVLLCKESGLLDLHEPVPQKKGLHAFAVKFLRCLNEWAGRMFSVRVSNRFICHLYLECKTMLLLTI